MTDKLMNALSLCRKAGAMTAGFDAVEEKLRKGEVELLFFASDVSEKTKKRVRPGQTPVYELPYTQAELSAVTKKMSGVLAVTNENLAALCRSVL